jgi:hypothetical protein
MTNVRDQPLTAAEITRRRQLGHTSMEKFAYDAPAEIFSSDARAVRKRPVTYRRFPSSAEAIRFAIEQLCQSVQRETVMEVEGDRIQIAQIRALYDSQRYPLSRQDPPPIMAATSRSRVWPRLPIDEVAPSRGRTGNGR